MEKFAKGLKLYGYAVNKAKQLGMADNSGKMEELICKIQLYEGNIVCFRRRKDCSEVRCCWQAACTAQMHEH